MTVVAVWYEASDDCLWCVADTRVSKPSETGRIVLTDSAAKIFSLNVRCAHITHDNIPYGLTYFEKDFGFAYSGNSLPALMTLSTASTILRALMSPDLKDHTPSLQQIAYFVRKLAEHFSREAWIANQSRDSLFEAVLFGVCPQSQQFELAHLKARLDGNSPAFDLVRQVESQCMTVLGSGKSRFFEHLERIKQSDQTMIRLPKRAVRATIEEGTELDVGGHISQAIADRSRFSIYYAFDPVERGSPFTRKHYNGIDLDRIGTVGPCSISGLGMSG